MAPRDLLLSNWGSWSPAPDWRDEEARANAKAIGERDAVRGLLSPRMRATYETPQGVQAPEPKAPAKTSGMPFLPPPFGMLASPAVENAIGQGINRGITDWERDVGTVRDALYPPQQREAEQFKPEPGHTYGSVLPYKINDATGERSWAPPKLLQAAHNNPLGPMVMDAIAYTPRAIKDAVTLPRRVMDGEVAPDDPAEVANFALNFVGGGGVAHGALGAKGARLGMNAPMGMHPRVALRKPDGTVLYGKPGQTHADVAMEHNYFPESADDSGFAYDGGPYMDRRTATEALQQSAPDAASKLRDPMRGQLESRDLAVASGDYVDAPPLRGMPTEAEVPGFGRLNVGPSKRIRKVALDYMNRAQRPYNPERAYVPVDPEKAAKVADEFDRMPHNPADPETRASYGALISEVKDQWHEIEKSGLKVEFMKPGMKDPYDASPRLAVKDIEDNNHLWVYPTEDGFGKAGFDPKGNPMLLDSGVTIDGRRVANNDLFRIVHDYFGHGKEGVGFRATGEDNAFRQHRAMFSPLARRALTTETRGQNSWLNYGPHGAKNRTAKTEDTVFADQKVGLLPEWTTLYANNKKGAPLSLAGGAARGPEFYPTTADEQLWSTWQTQGPNKVPYGFQAKKGTDFLVMKTHPSAGGHWSLMHADGSSFPQKFATKEDAFKYADEARVEWAKQQELKNEPYNPWDDDFDGDDFYGERPYTGSADGHYIRTHTERNALPPPPLGMGRVYHGTQRPPFSRFDLDYARNDRERALFATPKFGIAREYGKNVLPMNFDPTNSSVVDLKKIAGKPRSYMSEYMEAAIDEAQRAGKDSLIVKNMYDVGGKAPQIVGVNEAGRFKHAVTGDTLFANSKKGAPLSLAAGLGKDQKLVAARRMPDGSVRYAKPGQHHGDLFTDEDFIEGSPTYRNSLDPESAGFAYPGGPFMTRQEAYAQLEPKTKDAIGPDYDRLTAEDLKEVRKGKVYDPKKDRFIRPKKDTLFANSKKAAPLSLASGLDDAFPFDNPNAKVVEGATDDLMQRAPGEPTVLGFDPKDIWNPKLYRDPRTILDEVEVAPETGSMKRLFGVNRQELDEIGGFGTREGNISPVLQYPKRGPGRNVTNMMTPENAGRLQDLIAEAQKHGLAPGMRAWYVNDPLFRQFVKEFGPEQAIKEFQQYNLFTASHSPGTNVPLEITRGTLARKLFKEGRGEEWLEHGGLPGAESSSLAGDVAGAIPSGHMHHTTAANPNGLLGKLMRGSGHDLRFSPDNMKVNVYDQALGVPETGFQTRIAVPDGHHSRGAGKADVMPGLKTRADSMKTDIGAPWADFFRERVTDPLGIQAVPGQAIMWGALSKVTGVDTAVGMSKLELLAENIMRRARETGKSPEQVLSEVVRGTEFAANPATAAPMGLMPMSPVPEEWER